VQQHPVDASDRPDSPEAGDARRLLVEQAQVGICVANHDGYLFVNEHLARMLGYTPQEMVQGLRARDTIHPDDLPRVLEQVQQRIAGAPGRPYDVRSVRKDGSVIDTRVCGQRIEFDGQVADLVTLIDVSELKQALHTADWRARMLKQSETLCLSGSVEIDMNTGVATLSAGMCSLLGIDELAAPVSHRTLRRWLPQDEQQYVVSIWRGAVPGEPFEFQHRILRADGTRRVVLHRGMVEAAPGGGAGRGVAILQDITAQRDAERRIQELANYNDVTGLPNRALLLDRLDEAIHAARREGHGLALLSLSVAQVQQVKESIGYPAGDALAMAIAAQSASTTTSSSSSVKSSPPCFSVR